MALHLIISGLLSLLESDFLSPILDFSVQLLNFAVLLSYPINFFIYCRMSRAFRDAFTQLLCPSKNQSRQIRLHSTAATRLINKQYNNDDNYNDFENNTNIEMKNSDIKSQPPSSVIINHTTADALAPSKQSINYLHINNNEQRNVSNLIVKQHVLFRDDAMTSKKNKRFSDL